MGACYSKKAGQLGEAYAYPIRNGSPARLRKRSAMNRTAPYPRHSAATSRSAGAASTAGGPPGHSFGFRRRPGGGGGGGGGGGHRVQPVPPPTVRRAATTPSSASSDSLVSTGSDANGNQKMLKRTLPRPLVARVKPRTTAASTTHSGHSGSVTHGTHSNSTHSTQSANSNSSNSLHSTGSARGSIAPKSNSNSSSVAVSTRSSKTTELISPRKETLSRMDDSGVGTLQGSLSSTASTLSSVDASSPDDSQRLDVPQKLSQTMMPQTMTQKLTNVQTNHEVDRDDDHQGGEAEPEAGELRDFQVGIQTGGATIALSVNIHKGANPVLRRPQVTVHDAGGRARVTQIQRPGFGFTQPAGLTRPVGNTGPSRVGTGAASGAAGVGGVASVGTGVGVVAGPGAGPGAGAGDGPGAGAVIGGGNSPASGSGEGGVGTDGSGGGGGRSTTPVARPPPLTIPKPPVPTRSFGLDQTVRSRVTRWEEKVDQVRRETVVTPSRRGERPLSGDTSTNLAGLRREMRQLTRDVATSPLRRPPLRDTGTCTDSHVHHVAAHGAAHVGHLATRRGRHGEEGAMVERHGSLGSDAGSPLDILSPLASSDSPESRGGNEDFIDDEIDDQPAFGAYAADALSPGAFLDEMLSVGLSEPTSPPLPPLQITEALRDDYVRPFRLTPRPPTAITTLETPLRRWAAEPGGSGSDHRRQMSGRAVAEVVTSASERRQQMEVRAEQLAKRLGVNEGSPLGSTYQRLGLPDPATPESTAAAASDSTTTTTPAAASVPSSAPASVVAKPASSSSSAEASSPACPSTGLKEYSPVVSPASVASPTTSAQSSAVAGELDGDKVDHTPGSVLAQTENKVKVSSAPSKSSAQDRAVASPAEPTVTNSIRSSTGKPTAVASLPPSSSAASSSTTSPTSSVPASASTSAPTSLVPSACASITSPSTPPTSTAASSPAAETVAELEAADAPASLPASQTECRTSEPAIRPRLLSDEHIAREEDSLSDLESRDEVPTGCRPRRTSWRRLSELRELTSPTDSLNSDDLMADFDKDSDDAMDDDDSLTGQVSRLQRMRLRTSSSTDTGRPAPDPASKILRPPRQNSAQDADDWLLIDRDTYMYMAQDFTHTKTMLHKLRRLLQDADTTNPFENSLQAGRRGGSVSSESQLSSIDGRRSVDGGADLVAENADLKRQVAALQQQVTDQARTIRLLQQQMGSSASNPLDVSSVATQATQVVTNDPNIITAAPERG